MALDTTIAGASADSYGTLAEFQAYAASQGWTLTADTATQEVHLRRATAYLDRTYRFKGLRVERNQALEWPRYVDEFDDSGFVIPSDEIPQKIKNAQFELAWVAHGGTDLLATVTSGAVKVQRERVGPLESETEYFGNLTRPAYPAVAGLLREYIRGSSARLRRG